MKTISNELKMHLAGEVVTLATCWKLALTNGTVMGFTDHDRDINFESILYKAATGFTPTAIRNSADLAVDNLDIEGMLDSSAITDEDINAGLYDFAEIEIFQVNYTDLTQGSLKLRRGWIGEVTLGRGQFIAEVRGLTQRLSKTIGDLFSPSCRANLGDIKCGVDLAPFTKTGTITSVTDNRVFADSGRTEVAGFFDFGKITFTSGNNNGLSMEVKVFSAGGDMELMLPMAYDVQIGDNYSIIAGCDKTFDTCKNRFNNVINFRGEPHVPGTDEIFKTAGTR